MGVLQHALLGNRCHRQSLLQQSEGLRNQHEGELADVAEQLRKTEKVIERYLIVFENGSLVEELFAERIKQPSTRVAQLGHRRKELNEALAGGKTTAPIADQLQQIRNEVATALHTGDSAAQKRLVQRMVHEIKVDGRHKITPIFKVPNLPEGHEDQKVRAIGGLVVF
jgi:hypothetical protein